MGAWPPSTPVTPPGSPFVTVAARERRQQAGAREMSLPWGRGYMRVRSCGLAKKREGVRMVGAGFMGVSLHLVQQR
jgi:hypothetical protein